MAKMLDNANYEHIEFRRTFHEVDDKKRVNKNDLHLLDFKINFCLKLLKSI